MENANSIYDYTKPSQSIDEQRVTERLVANATANSLVRPPIPNIGKIPPRFGYRTTTPDLNDVLHVDQVFSSQWADYSGRVSGYQGTSFPSLAQF